MDMHNNSRGRIIFLGDGTEVLTAGDDEGKELDKQAEKSEPAHIDERRGEREETPGPEPQKSSEDQQNQVSSDTDSSTNMQANPAISAAAAAAAATATESGIKAIPESALPDKIVATPASQKK